MRAMTGLAALLASASCFGSTAVAEEPACRHEAGVGVVCSEEAFKTLVDQCVAFDRDGQLCTIRLEATKAELKATREAFETVQAAYSRTLIDLDKVKTDLAKAREKSWKPAAGALSAAVGTGLLMSTALFPAAGDGVRAGMGVGGLILVGTGLWLVW